MGENAVVADVKVLSKTMKTLSQDGAPAKIQTGGLPSTFEKCYCLSQLARWNVLITRYALSHFVKF
jgi:hypothetical protein